MDAHRSCSFPVWCDVHPVPGNARAGDDVAARSDHVCRSIPNAGVLLCEQNGVAGQAKWRRNHK